MTILRVLYQPPQLESPDESSLSSTSQDYGDFRNYVDDSVDPGNAILIATILFCVTLMALLPCVVAVCGAKNGHERSADQSVGILDGTEPDQSLEDETGDVDAARKTRSVTTSTAVDAHVPRPPSLPLVDEEARNVMESVDDLDEADVDSVVDASSLGHGTWHEDMEDPDDDDGDDSLSLTSWSSSSSLASMSSRYGLSKVQSHHREQAAVDTGEMVGASVTLEAEKVEEGVLGKASVECAPDPTFTATTREVLPDSLELTIATTTAEKATLYVPTQQHGRTIRKRLRRSSKRHSWMDDVLLIAEWDDETRRIVKLGVPFVLQALLIGTMETVRVALIGKLISTRALSAYVIVELLVGTSNVMLKGLQDACTTLCSQALGVGNKVLVGQYIQIATTLFILGSIPIFVGWMLVTGPIFHWLGFDDETTQMGEDFALLYSIASFVHGLTYSLHKLLDVIGYENFSTFFLSLQETAATLGVLVVALSQPSATNLYPVGFALIAVDVVALVLNVWIIVSRGWFQKYAQGLVGSVALLNVHATKVLLGTSVSLSLGGLVTYGEWELLAVFASFLGPAEVAAWGLLGTLWNALELVTHAVASAGGIRTAYLLGAGRPAQAKLSSYKTLYLGISAAVLYTAIVFVAGDDIPTWLTNDPTLQRMIADLVPLFGIGNIALSIGTMSWTLVGAQSRFRLSTWVNWSGAWFVMMPLAGLLTIAYNVNLQGQTAAIVIGYMVSGTINTFILLQSDWPKLSQRVIDRAGGVVDENDDSSVSSSHCSGSVATKHVDTAPIESSLHSDASKECRTQP